MGRTVLNSMLEQDAAEKRQEEAGDLNADKLGKYTITRKLGEDGMGNVWEAQDEQGQRVAVKLLPPHLAKERQFLPRFCREAQSTIKLQHPNIVRGIEVGEGKGNYFLPWSL